MGLCRHVKTIAWKVILLKKTEVECMLFYPTGVVNCVLKNV